MSGPKSELLTKLMAYAAEQGIADRSLREIADAVGSSHRMLIYHFGSRPGLIAAIVSEMEQRQRDWLTGLAAQATDETDLIRWTWQRVTQPEILPFVRLFFEVLALAAQQRPGTEGFAEKITEPWIEVGREAADAIGADMTDDDLRIVIALIRGLLIDVIATGDVDSAAAVLERFAGTPPGNSEPQQAWRPGRARESMVDVVIPTERGGRRRES